SEPALKIVGRVTGGCRRQCRQSGWVLAGVRKDGRELRRVNGLCDSVVILQFQNSLAQTRQRYRCNERGVLLLSPAFIRIEKEDLVFPHWPADRTAKNIAIYIRTSYSGTVIKEIVG